MEDVTSIIQSQVIVPQTENQRIDQQEERESQNNAAFAVADTTDISEEGVQLSQSIETLQQPSGQNENVPPQDVQGIQSEFGQTDSVPQFLDVRV